MSHWWQLPLHNQNALFIKRLFLFEDRVVLYERADAREGHPEAARPRPSERASIEAMNIRPATPRTTWRSCARCCTRPPGGTPIGRASRWKRCSPSPCSLRYYQGWGRPGDGGVVAEIDGRAGRRRLVPAVRRRRARLRLRRREDPRALIAVVAAAPAQRDRRSGPALLHGPGARGRVPVPLAVGGLAQPLADDVPAGGVRAGRGVEATTGRWSRTSRRAAVGSSLGPLPSLASLAQSRRSLEVLPRLRADGAASAAALPDPPGDRATRAMAASDRDGGEVLLEGLPLGAEGLAGVGEADAPGDDAEQGEEA